MQPDFVPVSSLPPSRRRSGQSVGGVPGGSVVKNLPASAGDPGSIPAPRRAPEEDRGHALQDSCLENPVYRRA